MRWSPVFRAVWLAALIATQWPLASASGQEPPPSTTTTPKAPALESETAPIPPPPQSPLPVLPAYPVEMLGLLAPGRGGTTLVPGIGVSEEWNSNIFLDNSNPQSDFITAITPTLFLYVEQPRFRLVGGISTSGEYYAKDTSLGNAFSRSAMIVGGSYSVSPDLTLRVSDAFSFDRGTGSGWQSFSVGRELSVNNRATAGLSWLFARASLDVSGTYELNRYPGSGNGIDSDSYSVRGTLNYSLTPRFTVSPAYEFTYLAVAGSDDSATHTPTLGLRYQVTRTFSAAVSGGPAITQVAAGTFVTPAGNILLMQAWQLGTLTLQYDRGISVAGGFGGTTDHQTASATFAAPTWIRDLVVRANVSYNKAKSLDTGQAGAPEVDATSITVTVGTAYYLTRYFNIYAGYDYLRQRTGSSSTTQVDGDQHRVRVGLQLGYPIALQ